MATINGTSSNDSLVGTSAVDTLYGAEGNDTLDGGVGADVLIGGLGDDEYWVDNINDSVVEELDSGVDTLQINIATANATYTLGDHIENANLNNNVAFNLTGNDLNNTLAGNNAANILSGGLGADTMIGGAGDDLYVVDNIKDVIVENLNTGGFDQVLSTVDFDMSDNSEGNNRSQLERLDLLGSNAINAVGNSLNNTLIGNDGDNVLSGGVGVDTLIGGAGNDIYKVDLIRGVGSTVILEDTIIEYFMSVGIDTVELVLPNDYSYSFVTTASKITLGSQLENLDASNTQSLLINLSGNTLANELTGNEANNILYGEAGVDTLKGGAGNDVLYGGIEADVLIGGTGDDTLDGGSDVDALIGGLGDDMYWVDNIDDIVVEDLDSGVDTLQINIATANATYTLGNHIENANLNNNVAFNLTGNDLNNTLAGNNAANILNGGLGADTMSGGAGNDTYVVDSINDVIVENLTLANLGGTDTVQASVDFDMTVATGGNNRTQLENVTLLGSNSINAMGNSLNNTLIGNVGDNVLSGGTGVDTLIGGVGNDTYQVDLIRSGGLATVILEDSITEYSNQGIDTIELALRNSYSYSFATTATNLTLGDHLENLDASHTQSLLINLSGNTLSNVLTANDANNTLDGGAGLDTLIGGTGDDTYIVDNILDEVIENSLSGIDNVQVNILIPNQVYTLSANIENARILNGVAFELNGNSENNNLIGNDQANTINGAEGNDTLDGGFGADVLIGGLGVDTFIGSYNSSTYIEDFGYGGSDALFVSSNSKVIVNVTDNWIGNANTKIYGRATLYTAGYSIDASDIGYGGLDIVNIGNATTLVGRKNMVNSFFIKGIGDTVIGGTGSDVLDYSNATTGVSVDVDTGITTTTNGTDSFSSIGFINGSTYDDFLSSSQSKITLNGGTGNDTINTSSAYSVLKGGSGLDTFIINTGTSSIEDLGLGGADKLIVEETATVSATLAREWIATSDSINKGAISFLTKGFKLDLSSVVTDKGFYAWNNGANASLIGSSQNDTLIGGFSTDTISGGLGNDSLTGGEGVDEFIVTSGIDEIADLAYHGESDILIVSDGATVNSRVSNWTASSLTQNFGEVNLFALGSLNLSAITSGNGFNITTSSNGGKIIASRFNDYLTGLGGYQTLTGGLGLDRFEVKAGTVLISDFALGGNELLNVANAATANINLANSWLASSGNINNNGQINITSNGYSADLSSITSGNGNFKISNTGLGTTLIGSQINDSIVGGNYADTLIGNFGNNTLVGGGGIDKFIVVGQNDSITDLGQGGNDVLQVQSNAVANATLAASWVASSASFNSGVVDLKTNGYSVDLTAINSETGNGYKITNTGIGTQIKGSKFNDTLESGVGNNTMSGGEGQDSFIVSGGINSILDLSNSDILKVQSSAVVNAELTSSWYATNESSNLGAVHLNTNGYSVNLSNIVSGKGYEIINQSNSSSLIGSQLNDTIIAGNQHDSITGGLGVDEFKITNGTASILDLGLGGADILNIASGASVDANMVGNWTASSSSSNLGSATLYTNGYTLDLTSVTTGNGFNLNNTGSAGIFFGSKFNDTITGGTWSDTVNYSKAASAVNVDLSQGISSGGSGQDILSSIEILVGSKFNDTLSGNTANETLIGSGGNDIIKGYGGNDSLVADGGDSLDGGFGSDNLNISGEGNAITGGTGSDRFIFSSIRDSSKNVITDFGLTDSIYFNEINKSNLKVTLGDGSTNQFGEIQYHYESGNTILEIGLDSIAGADASITINGISNPTLNNIYGSYSANYSLVGTNGTDTLIGAEGNDTLDGGAGADLLTGGLGDDVYWVDNSNDSIVEALDSGTDTVNITIATANGSYTLADDLENATLANQVAFNLTGNTLANVLTGNSAANTLNGGEGADTMSGGAGNDVYVVDNINDVVVENLSVASKGGIDTVQSSVDFDMTVATGGNNRTQLENVTLQGSNAINAVGNSLNNTLIGNAGDNVLSGGLGVDTLKGGAGNDTYQVDLVRNGRLGTVMLEDSITENLNDGIDTIKLALRNDYSYSFATTATNLTLGTHLENIDASETQSLLINLLGNNLANELTGNDANNILDGGVGLDTLMGGAGDDTYVIDDVLDVVIEDSDSGVDNVLIKIATANQVYELTENVDNASLMNAVAFGLTGNSLNNHLIGNAWSNTLIGAEGNDTLNGGAGADELIGGLGDDVYWVDNINDQVEEEVDSGVDTVLVNTTTANATYTLGEFIENANLNNNVAFNLTGNDLNNTLVGNSAANILSGGLGADTMSGGAGNDVYVVDNINDVVVENLSVASKGGIDTVQSSVDFDMTVATGGNNRTQLENVTLQGSNAINAVGNSLNNTLIGNAGDNVLSGGLGVDTLKGGAGNDTYQVDLVRNGKLSTLMLEDSITENLNDGIDTIELALRSAYSYSFATTATNLTLSNHLENLDASETQSLLINLLGNNLANELTGNDANNILDGGVGVDTLTGGAGNDTYVIDDLSDLVIEGSESGVDNVQIKIATANQVYELTENVDNASLMNTVAFGLTGNDLDNLLVGNAWANTLIGAEGNDTLNGGAGADELIGGLGDDVYWVDNINDRVEEEIDSGVDTVLINITTANATYTLGEFIENAKLNNNVAFNLTGNDLDNTLTGNSAANILNGGHGADTMSGGAGNDVYVVDDINDVVVENLSVASKGGIDTVQASVDFDMTVATGGNNRTQLENVTLQGSNAINAVGNSLNNTLIGNAGDNVLSGGLGVDTLKGGAGNDTYQVDLVRNGKLGTVMLEDSITENLNDGIDTIKLALRNDYSYSFATTATNLTLSTHLENIDASETQSLLINLLGNNLANELTGNDANNILDGGVGVDTLTGGAGNDTYVIDNLLDLVIEGSESGVDNVQIKIATANQVYELTENVDNASLMNAVAFGLTGNSLDNELIGNAWANTLIGAEGNDTLNGGAGADELIGGLGDDVYWVDNINDRVEEEIDSGVDTVLININTANATYTLGDFIENANLNNNVAFNLTGNDLDNTLTGNSAANILNGGHGADTMSGGAGNDVYVVDDINDVVVENLSVASKGGIDTVQASVDFDMTVATGGNNRTQLENVTLQGSNAINAVGNSLNNTLIGNAGDNVLSGGLGVDTLKGGAGNDTYQVDLVRNGKLSTLMLEDSITENLNDGIDTIELALRNAYSYSFATTATNLTLGNYLENIDASATQSLLINLLGNNLANELTGNDADNILDGGVGLDTLIGGAGNDTYVIDDLSDLVIEGSDSGVDNVQIKIAIANQVYELTENVDDACLMNEVAFSLTGNSLDNHLVGNAWANTLIGAEGNDTLNGHEGADVLIGGLGDDFYWVDDINDQVKEEIDSGVDMMGITTTTANATYTLSENIEKAFLLNAVAFGLTGNSLDNELIGNAWTNTLTGGEGNDTLDGGAGADILIGGLGDDVYWVDNINDQVKEEIDSGLDTVYIDITTANATYTLSEHIEYARLNNKVAFNLTGNDLDNSLSGNSADNILNGGLGADFMYGEFGNDVYVVDDINDVVVEYFDAGIDTVLASVDFDMSVDYLYYPSQVENVTLQGSNAINAVGNSLNNTLIGNAGNNELAGGLGTDTLKGASGNDTYRVDLVRNGEMSSVMLEDIVIEQLNEGIDTVELSISDGYSYDFATTAGNLTLGNHLENLDASDTQSLLINLLGNNLANELTGNDGNNLIAGGLGNDVLTGGAGNDIFRLDTSLNELNNIDVITDFLSGIDKIQLENGIFKNLTYTGSLKEVNFFKGADFVPQDATNYILYNESNGGVYYDADGTGVNSATQFLTLLGVPNLSASDFIVI